jgi:hypothetical protein
MSTEKPNSTEKASEADFAESALPAHLEAAVLQQTPLPRW